MQRNQGESFEAYKARRAAFKTWGDSVCAGTFSHVSVKYVLLDGELKRTKGVTYRNPKRALKKALKAG